ncbi:MAG: Methyltransferase type 11 [Gemmatimonadetes bacterium]|nr:Methyltransferase type 11 [Gemmatimonadota bacterium]
MAFDEHWEDVFRRRTWGRYPSEELVRLLLPRFPDTEKRKNSRILDLGCGGGANAWFLAREGFDTYGIDGSPSAIGQAEQLLGREGCKATLAIGDFVVLKYPDASFDAIVDANAIQHNTWADITRCHAEIRRVLKPGGYFFGMLLNDESSGADTAEIVELNTYRGFKRGPVGADLLAHLFTRVEVDRLFRGYEELQVERLVRTMNGGADQAGHFIVVAKKA